MCISGDMATIRILYRKQIIYIHCTWLVATEVQERTQTTFLSNFWKGHVLRQQLLNSGYWTLCIYARALLKVNLAQCCTCNTDQYVCGG